MARRQKLADVQVADTFDPGSAPSNDNEKHEFYRMIKQGMADDGYVHLPDHIVNQLDSHLIEVDGQIRNANGDPAVRLNSAGVERFSKQDGDVDIKTGASEKVKVASRSIEASDIIFEDEIEIPKSTRTTTSKYNFDKMVIGKPLFVADLPAEGDLPARDAKKALLPSVSNANRKFKAQGMHWIVRSAERDGVKGARVWRKS